ncbi:hypothetical protein [Parafrankia sp. EUN1f]|uniref:hypothetical protein n=1 Tax=Parafrankia sp. EUN1f TaxID=102897 RepID=UPI0001C46D25|nr:hypothetical protein [Parafrankia sp. EUN1f]EFC80083.1 hypothetical protein FrEUN1fDRAFT_6810 [Parafrankia sp. EUN1f]
MPDRFAIRLPDGRTAYHLPSTTEGLNDRGADVPAKPQGSWTSIDRWTTADGTRLQALPVENWWIVPTGTAGPLHAHLPGSTRVTGYQLEDPETESAKYPLTLTVEEGRKRLDQDWETFGLLYRTIREDVPGDIVTLEISDAILLDGDLPVLPSGCSWTPDLPYVLGNWPEYGRLFPGKLTGYQRGLVDAVRRAVPTADIDWWDHSNPHEFNLTVRRAYQPGRTIRVDVSGPRARRPRFENKPDRRTLYFTVHLGREIRGENVVAALATLEEFTAEVCADVAEAVAETPCGHCAGTGYVEPQAGGPIRERRL